MNTTPVNKNLFEGVIVNAISSAFDGEASEDEFAIRAIFGLETIDIPEPSTCRRMMEVIMDAAIEFLGQPKLWDAEEVMQNFLREKIIDLSLETDKRCTLDVNVRREFGEIEYLITTMIGYGNTVQSTHIDSAINEARRRAGFNAANQPKTLIEPPQADAVGQVAGDGRVIIDEDVESVTGGEFDDEIPF